MLMSLVTVSLNRRLSSLKSYYHCMEVCKTFAYYHALWSEKSFFDVITRKVDWAPVHKSMLSLGSELIKNKHFAVSHDIS